jgi:DNA modification methylase
MEKEPEYIEIIKQRLANGSTSIIKGDSVNGLERQRII